MNPSTTPIRARARARTALPALALGVLLASSFSFSSAAGAAAAKVGGRCAKAGAKSGTLVCTRKAGKLVWARPATTTKATAKTAAGVGAPTTAASSSGAATATPDGIEGTWKATTQSVLGYRVKEVLIGQDTEGVGRTNAVTGSMVINGTKAVSAELTVDVRTLRSDDQRRDGQVQGRILSTAQFPTATMKLVQPVDFGKVPGDKEVVSAKAKVDLTLRGTKKTIDVDLQARRNGANVEVNGAIAIKFSEWNIPNPTSALATVGDDGTIEFVVVFAR